VQKSVEVFETKALECVGERRVRGNPNQARTLVLSICTIQAMETFWTTRVEGTFSELGKRHSCPICKNG